MILSALIWTCVKMTHNRFLPSPRHPSWTPEVPTTIFDFDGIQPFHPLNSGTGKCRTVCDFAQLHNYLVTVRTVRARWLAVARLVEGERQRHRRLGGQQRALRFVYVWTRRVNPFALFDITWDFVLRVNWHRILVQSSRVHKSHPDSCKTKFLCTVQYKCFSFLRNAFFFTDR